MHLYSALSVLKIGCDLLLKEEHAALDTMYGHGGFFKTEGVGQNILAAALDVPVTVMSTAGEGGAWGVALLAAYRVRGNGAPLESWLKTDVFGEEAGKTVQPDPEAVAGFNAYLDRYVKGLPIERASVDCYKG
jgi:sugar (pentulose or hexulose) kinase